MTEIFAGRTGLRMVVRWASKIRQARYRRAMTRFDQWLAMIEETR